VTQAYMRSGWRCKRRFGGHVHHVSTDEDEHSKRVAPVEPPVGAMAAFGLTLNTSAGVPG
jgi:hypothetical protein